jgi:general secretion pathway protein F
VALSFRKKAEFFGQWSRLLASGLPPIKSLEFLADRLSGSSAVAARALAKILVEGNDPVFESPVTRRYFSERDCLLLSAGQQAGALDRMLESLAGYYEERLKLRNHLLSRSSYPVLVFHLGIFLLPIAVAIREGGLSYYSNFVLVSLGIAYGIAALGWGGVMLLRMGIARSEPLARFWARIPWLGPWFVLPSLVRFSDTLALEISAGLSFLGALQDAGQGSGNAFYRASSRRVVRAVRGGASLCEALTLEKGFPYPLELALLAGEASGRLEEETRRVHLQFKEQYKAMFDALAEWAPRILYLGVALFVAWQIIQTYLATYQALGEIFEL